MSISSSVTNDPFTWNNPSYVTRVYGSANPSNLGH
eukprot:CAMPEP_0196215244 /NCGR_PEP_ID=MMETSP0912-20130531/29468_1 /TAXON_ID=49265 /ORGANISM="Thalassiosira rotula, Strain GSO102" /LENGTH=34 /DNA_ID= /DNA_START= /DNA_END= /DNA_ORIENTATION=